MDLLRIIDGVFRQAQRLLWEGEAQVLHDAEAQNIPLEAMPEAPQANNLPPQPEIEIAIIVLTNGQNAAVPEGEPLMHQIALGPAEDEEPEEQPTPCDHAIPDGQVDLDDDIFVCSNSRKIALAVVILKLIIIIGLVVSKLETSGSSPAA